MPPVRASASKFVTAGGWAAASGECDDRATIVQTNDQLLAVIAEGSSPTYGGYYTPLGLDLAISTIVDTLRGHRHACTLACVEAAGAKAHAALFALESEHRAAQICGGLEESARAGGIVAARRGYAPGPRLVNCFASLTAAVVTEARVFIMQIGMGRAYRSRGPEQQLLLDDHSLLTQMRRRGEELDPAHASVVNRLLGSVGNEAPDFGEFPFLPGDRLLLCTDGVWRLGDDALRTALTRATASDVVRALESLVGSSPRDDAAAIVVDVR